MKHNQNKIQRRSFLKMGITGLAGLSAGPTILKGKEKRPTLDPGRDRKIIYRTLGKTGLKLPIVSMGVMNSDNPNLVAAALEAGIIYLDTAWGYQRGRNETLIGGVIKDRPRDSYIIATKVPKFGIRLRNPAKNPIRIANLISTIEKPIAKRIPRMVTIVSCPRKKFTV